LIASCDLLSVHGLLRSLVAASLSLAVRSDPRLRTAIIRMLVPHRSTSALPVHGGPLRGAHATPLAPQKRPTFVPQDDPCGGRGAPRENAALWTSGGAPTRVPKPSRSDRSRCLSSQSLRASSWLCEKDVLHTVHATIPAWANSVVIRARRREIT